MPDMENAIKTLESILDADIYDNWLSGGERQSVCDAIALLKEQDAVEPRIQTDFDGKGTWWYICGSCNNAVSPKDKYCRECGKMVKWEWRTGKQ